MKVLVANRGEIAVRVMRACREMGVPTVGVFSPSDRLAPHVRYADEAVGLGADRPAESYLDSGKLIDGRAPHRRRYGASRLRIPCGKRGVRRRLPGCGPALRRSRRRRHRADGREDGVPQRGAGSRRAGRARDRWSPGGRFGRRRGAPAGIDDRFSAVRQGGRRRRREGHAPGARPGVAARRGTGGAVRGGDSVRQPRRLRGAVRHGGAPYRGAAAGRRTRQCRPVRRA